MRIVGAALSSFWGTFNRRILDSVLVFFLRVIIHRLPSKKLFEIVGSQVLHIGIIPLNVTFALLYPIFFGKLGIVLLEEFRVGFPA